MEGVPRPPVRPSPLTPTLRTGRAFGASYRGTQGDLRIGRPHPGTHGKDPGRRVSGERPEMSETRDPVGESQRVRGREHGAIMAARASTEQPPCAAGSRRT